MRSALAFAVLVLVSGCKKSEPPAAKASVDIPVKAVVGGVDMIEYEEPHGSFVVNAPATWKIRETDDLGPEATFIGPGTVERPNSADIHISFYPNPIDKSADPKHYFEGLSLIESMKTQLDFGKRLVGGREVESYAFERPFRKLHSRKIEYMRRDTTAIIRFGKGFWSISHSAPADSYQATYPIFEAVVASFKPGEIPAK